MSLTETISQTINDTIAPNTNIVKDMKNPIISIFNFLLNLLTQYDSL